jgi:hypothetical protein
MIPHDDQRYIIDKLLRLAARIDHPRQWITSAFVTVQMPDLRGQTTPELVTNTVAVCIRDGWNQQPCLLRLLIETLLPYQTDARLAAIHAFISPARPGPPDPLRTHVLDGKTPFLNRHGLRQHLGTLRDGRMPNVLLVDGDAQAGKTYSEKMITACFQPRSFVSVVAFTPEFGPTLAPLQVAKHIVMMLGGLGPPPPEADSDEQVNARMLAAWVLTCAAASDHDHCIVLDNFRGQALNQPTHLFVKHLAALARQGRFVQRGWLILIGCDLPLDDDAILGEQIVPCGRGDVTACVQEVFTNAGVAFDVAVVVDAILDQLPASPDRMPTLNTRLRALIAAVPEVHALVLAEPELDGPALLAALVSGLARDAAGMEEFRARLAQMKAVA